MSGVKERQKRDLEVIQDVAKIKHLLQKYLYGRTMFLRGFDPPPETRLEIMDGTNIILIHSEQDIHVDEQLIFFRILGRYIQITCKVQEQISDGVFRAVVEEAAVAKAERKSLRVPLGKGEGFVTNIRTSKTIINATLFTVPTSVKVNFGTYEHNLKTRFDYVKIDVYDKKVPVLEEIRRHGQSVYLRDTQDAESYKPFNDACLDYADFLDHDLIKTMNEKKQNKFVSECIVPVNYITHDQVKIPLGYIQVGSFREKFEGDILLELNQLAFEMVDRIRDSNTILVREHQRVLNVSHGGIKVLIEHADLIAFLARQNGFTFDLFFKGQAPITLHGVIRSVLTISDKALVLGVQISGNSSRDGEMKRFKDNVAQRESYYKTNFVKKK